MLQSNGQSINLFILMQPLSNCASVQKGGRPVRDGRLDRIGPPVGPGVEPPVVKRRIQRLLLHAYFSNTQDGPSLMAYLLRSCPTAGLAFCTCLPGSNGKGDPPAAEFVVFHDEAA